MTSLSTFDSSMFGYQEGMESLGGMIMGWSVLGFVSMFDLAVVYACRLSE
jgi:hypothetical protein